MGGRGFARRMVGDDEFKLLMFGACCCTVIRRCTAVLCYAALRCAVLCCVVCRAAVLAHEWQGGESTHICFLGRSFAVEHGHFVLSRHFPSPLLVSPLRLGPSPCYPRAEYAYMQGTTTAQARTFSMSLSMPSFFSGRR